MRNKEMVKILNILNKAMSPYVQFYKLIKFARQRSQKSHLVGTIRKNCKLRDQDIPRMLFVKFPTLP